MSDSKILFGDSRKMLNTLPDGSVDLCVTSPPYKDCDGYSDELVRDVFAQVYRVQKENSLLFLNFGHLAEDKFRPFRACSILMDLGYKLNDTIIWVKNHYKPIQGSKRLNNLTEFIFMLYKGKMPTIDRLALGVPYKDKTNAKRFAKGLDLKCGGNVWHINYETITRSDEKLHHDRFPVALPERCIKLCKYPVDVVLDPFFGSGTTGLAAKNLGKSYIGIEQDAEVYTTAFTRLGGV
jgi:site-specific DNA-methyltransferase (adenine-specific)